MRLLLPLLALLLSACSPGYVLRAAYEEGRILQRREPIVDLLEQPQVDAADKEKLRLVLMLREFASRLGLDVGGSYRTYAKIDANQTIHALSASPRFKLEPYTWWFPFVGRMPYKGFFSESAARREAAALQAKGFDTILLPVAAFSTLGWLDDPLLSNLLEHDDVVLANIVLHELTHNTWYAPGQAAFNESFANFVGGRGAIEFFTQLDGADSPRAVRARALWHDDLLYSDFLARLIARLEEAYAQGISLEQREAIFREEQEKAAAQGDWQSNAYRRVAEVKLNNALILHQWVYNHDLALFDRAYEAEGGDLRASIASIIEAASGAEDPFAGVGDALEKPRG